MRMYKVCDSSNYSVVSLHFVGGIYIFLPTYQATPTTASFPLRGVAACRYIHPAPNDIFYLKNLYIYCSRN